MPQLTDPPSSNIKTADIRFAAFLLVAGAAFLGCEKFQEEKKNLRLVQFVFKKPPDFRTLKRDFYASQEGSKVPAKSLFDRFKDLKRLAEEAWD